MYITQRDQLLCSKTNNFIDSCANKYQIRVFALQTMSQLTFSRRFQLEGVGSVESLVKTLQDSQSLLGTYAHVPWLFNLAEFVPFLLSSSERFTQAANEMVRHRRHHKPNEEDLFGFLLQTKDNPHAAGFPLRWEARLAVVAGL